ncbi:hypothetical protein ABIE73_004613 [Bradyrhizobium yuanmingense]
MTVALKLKSVPTWVKFDRSKVIAAPPGRVKARPVGLAAASAPLPAAVVSKVKVVAAPSEVPVAES